MLLALQCHERAIVPERVAGFRTWLKLGRAVKKNEKALRILAPVTVKERDERREETGERRVFFKTAFVFELSQTEPVAGVELGSLEPPREPLTGDSRAHLIEPMVAFAASLGSPCRSSRSPGRRAAGAIPRTSGSLSTTPWAGSADV
jgi:hypothetical protein